MQLLIYLLSIRRAPTVFRKSLAHRPASKASFMTRERSAAVPLRRPSVPTTPCGRLDLSSGSQVTPPLPTASFFADRGSFSTWGGALTIWQLLPWPPRGRELWGSDTEVLRKQREPFTGIECAS